MPDETVDWLQRLGKWRTVFASWQLGTRSKNDPEAQAVRDVVGLNFCGRKWDTRSGNWQRRRAFPQ